MKVWGLKIGKGYWITIAWQEIVGGVWQQRYGLMIEGPCWDDGRVIVAW